MPNPNILARQPYTKRPVPIQYDKGWFDTELGNISRSIPPGKSRTAMQDDTPSVTDSLVLYDATHGAITVTLRPPGQVQDLRLILKKIDNSGNTVTIKGVVDGVVNPTLTTVYQSMTIQSNGFDYYLLATT